MGGYEWARIEHFTLTILFTLFFVVHIIQVILAGWNNFQSMVTGLFILGTEKDVLVPSIVPVVESQKVEIHDFPKNEKITNNENVIEKDSNDETIIGKKTNEENIIEKNNSEADEPDIKTDTDE